MCDVVEVFEHCVVVTGEAGFGSWWVDVVHVFPDLGLVSGVRVFVSGVRQVDNPRVVAFHVRVGIGDEVFEIDFDDWYDSREMWEVLRDDLGVSSAGEVADAVRAGRFAGRVVGGRAVAGQPSVIVCGDFDLTQ